MRISDWSSDLCSSYLFLRLAVLAADGLAIAYPTLSYFLLVETVTRRGPLRVRALVRVRWPRTGRPRRCRRDRKSVVKGKSVSVSVELGGSRILKKHKRINYTN